MTSMQRQKDQLWASLYLPDLQLDDINSDNALAVVERCNHRQQIRCCNVPARQSGIYPSMTLNSAYALLPDLTVVEYNEQIEQNLLYRIGKWAMQFSSIVSVHEPNHILIEIAGSKKLFEGFSTLVHLIEEGLSKLGYNSQIGIAPTPLAANLLARANIRLGITDRQRLKVAISQLPVSLLELPKDTIDGLSRSGMHQIGNVADVSPASLTRRFGCACVDYFDRLLGRHPDPRTPLRLGRTFEREFHLIQEIQDISALQFATQRMINELAAFLIAQDKGINTFQFSLHHEKHQSTELQLRFLQATSQARHLHQVLTERLAQVELVAPVCGLHLFADTFSDVDRDAADFFVKSRQQQKSLGEVIDQLCSRLGKEALYTLTTVDDHRPEKAWKKSFIDLPSDSAGDWPSRPLWLLKQPLQMQSDYHTVDSSAERIETGWWEASDVRRDYFLIQDNNGTRYWAFRNRSQARDQTNNRSPRSNTVFIHGIFA